MKGWCSGGSPTAKYIKKRINTPAQPPSLVIMPRVRVSPINKSPSINNQSTKTLPAMEWKNSANGPCTPNCRNPVVGEPPESHADSGAVVKPKPNNLSKKAHKKTRPILNLKIPKIALNLFDSIIIMFLSAKNYSYPLYTKGLFSCIMTQWLRDQATVLIIH